MTTLLQPVYPWLEAAWALLQQYRLTDRLPHALLLQGPAGLGKTALAQALAARLLCRGDAVYACGQCPGCRLFMAGTHPDFLLIGPEESGKVVKVDRVRKLIADLELKPHYGGHRISVIEQADWMNLSAANALLKTLEEPAPGNLIVLVSEQPSRLPPTILSRCHKLSIQPPTHREAADWLRTQRPDCVAEVLLSAADGSPLRALALADTDVVSRRQERFREFSGVLLQREDPLMVAERWLAGSAEECFDRMLSWLADLMPLTLMREHAARRNPDLSAELQRLAGRLNAQVLSGFWDQLLKSRQALTGQVNRQLLLEETLIRWAQLDGADGGRSIAHG